LNAAFDSSSTEFCFHFIVVVVDDDLSESLLPLSTFIIVPFDMNGKEKGCMA
jgi:hypothetical protein